MESYLKLKQDTRAFNSWNDEITEIVLVHCNIVNNDYQKDSRALHTFISGKLFGQLLEISPKKLIFLKNLVWNFHISKYGLLIKILNY